MTTIERAAPPRRARPHGARERLGDLVGRSAAPVIARISRARGARMFHPTGLTFTGSCEGVASDRFGALGERLAGRILARCSQALWRGPIERLDVLGIAVRFRCERAADARQDLLFATIRSPLTMPLAPLTTDASDFFANHYWAVAPFAAGVHHRLKLRLRPVDPVRTTGSRRDRLLAAVAAGRASWSLEARTTLGLGWHPIARLSFDAPSDVDQEALRFDPFRAGAGFVPVGFVHAIRRAAYAASQRARPPDAARLRSAA